MIQNLYTLEISYLQAVAKKSVPSTHSTTVLLYFLQTRTKDVSEELQSKQPKVSHKRRYQTYGELLVICDQEFETEAPNNLQNHL